MNRVSTHNPTSDSQENRAVAVQVDKLICRLEIPVARDELVRRIRVLDLGHRMLKLRDRRWYLEVGNADQTLHFLIGHPSNSVIAKIITRPAAFSSITHYEDQIRCLLTDAEISEMTIIRVDLAIDYALPLERVVRGLEVKFKRAKIAYMDHGSARTGLLIGKGTEKLLVYDKARESGVQSPLTRVKASLAKRWGIF